MDSEQERVYVVAELNRVRALGCPCGGTYFGAVGPLGRDTRLDDAALWHCQEMARRGLLDHTGLDGRDPFQRIRAVGYTFRAAAENIASGNAAIVPTVQQLLSSPGHCQNIMSPLYTQVGVGHATSQSGQHFWTLDFATPA
jgi:uncharacterized protein YkwD